MNTWLRDAELGETLAMLPWVRGGITNAQPDPFIPLQRVFLFSGQDLDLAKLVAGLGWFADGVGQLEFETLTYLEGIADRDPDLARNVASLDWFDDDISETKFIALTSLRNIAHLDIGLAQSAATQPWFTSRMTSEERFALAALESLARIDIALAVRVSDASSLWSPRLVASSLRSLRRLRQSPQQFDVLAAKPWFADGLSRADAAFLATFRDTERRWPEFYDELMEAHYTESGVIDTPLAGEVTIWVIGNRPIDPPGYLVDHIARAITASEEFIGEPFPTQDVILLYADGHSFRGAYFGSHMALSRREEGDPLSPYTIFHETGHYYMHGGLGNTWLVEGGAHFLMTIGLAEIGVRELDEWPARLARSVREGCMLDPGFGVVQDIIDYDKDADTRVVCNYPFGLYFLHSLRAAMGHDAIATALREIYRAGRRLSEEEIYGIFLSNASLDRRERVQNVYVELHGGPFVTGFEDVEPKPSVPAALSSELPAWSGGPPDKVHTAALATIVNVWELDAPLGLSLARAAWVVDGVDHGEAIALNALREMAAVDPQLAGRIFNYSWVADGVVFWERKAIEAVARLAAHSRGDAERFVGYSWVVDGVTNEERLLLEFMAGAAAAADDAGAPFPRIAWMEDDLTDEEDYLFTSLRGLMALDNAFCVDVLTLPWVVGGASDQGEEARAVRGLTYLVEASGQLANNVLRLEWVADDMMTLDESVALAHIGRIARRNVQDAGRIINSPWSGMASTSTTWCGCRTTPPADGRRLLTALLREGAPRPGSGRGHRRAQARARAWRCARLRRASRWRARWPRRRRWRRSSCN